jgi:hypothetical protein
MQIIKVTKIPFLGMDQDTPDSTLKQGFYRRADNLLPPDTASGFNLENVPSFVLRENASIPSGTNTCVGAFEDKENNQIVYFLHNSGNNHGIWKFNPQTNAHTLIVQSSNLGFLSTYRIHSAGVIRNVLYWVDDVNIVRCVDMDTPPSGTIEDKRIALDKPRPQYPPTLVGALNASLLTNRVVSDSWQFACQFIYKNNERSLFGPVSKLFRALLQPEAQINQPGINTINVTQLVDSAIAPDIKKIRFAYIKNGDGVYNVFSETTATGATSYAVSFNNFHVIETVSQVESSFVNAIPRSSASLAVKDDRIFLTNDLDNYEDIGTGALSLTKKNGTSTSPDQTHLPGCSYKYGIVHFDDFDKTNGVVAETMVSFATQSFAGEPFASSSDRKWVTWALTGTPPSWAKRYAIVRTRNLSVESYFNTKALILFYKNEGTSAASDEVVFDGKVYRDSLPSTWSGDGKFLTMRLPDNIPVSLDETYKVKILNSGYTDKIASITRIVGNSVELSDNMGITNWTGKSGYLDVEFFKIKETPESEYFEIGQLYNCSGGSYTTTGSDSYGDVFTNRPILITTPTTNVIQIYHDIRPTAGTFGAGYSSLPGGATTPSRYAYVNYSYSPSPTTSGSVVETLRSLEVSEAEERADLNSGLGDLLKASKGKGTTTKISDAERVYTFDYSKICSDTGRSFPVIRNKQVTEDENTISFSNPYIKNSNLNGTTRFESSNKYTIPLDRSKSRRIVPVSTSAVLLAIHERSTTSLYVGEGFINSADGSELITKTSGVLGSQGDRQLTGSFGSVHPESIVEHNGTVYWFDAYSGEVVRYRNGLEPIGSRYKMASYFRSKIGYEGLAVGGYDPYLNVYFLTFIDDNETVAFADVDGHERWLGYFPFVPDYYCKTNETLYAFKDGEMWQLGVTGGTYNSYFGVVSVSSSVKTVFNEDYSKEKILMNTSIESDSSEWFVPTATNILGQETRLINSKFKRIRNVSYADWLKDLNTNTDKLKAGQIPIIHGDVMSSKSFDITYENPSDNKIVLEAVNIGFDYAPGHRTV